jgi:hypothetical protein
MKKIVLVFYAIIQIYTLVGQNFNRSLFIDLEHYIDVQPDDTWIFVDRYEVRNNRTDEIYAISYYFKSQNSDSINIHIVPDRSIYYEEYDSMKILVSHGELQICFQSKRIQSFIFDEDSYSTTYYQLVPHGTWHFKDSYTLVTRVEYVMGKKHGRSFSKIDFIYPERILEESYFESDTLIKTNKTFELIDSMMNKQILGDWFLHQNLCFDSERDLFYFKREKSMSRHNGLTSATFHVDNTLTGQKRYSCGVGRNPEDYIINSTWELLDDKILIFNNWKLEILYLTENEMILLYLNRI